MQHFFSYYPDNQSVTIPDANAIGVFGPIGLTTSDRERILSDALATPVNSEPLHRVANAEDRVLIVVDDTIEPTPVVFPFFHVITELHKAGVKDANIQVLVANESFRQSTSEEIDRQIGAEMHKKYRVFQSHGDEREQHVFGTVAGPFGPFPVAVNHMLRDATLVIGITGVYPDRFLGFSGSGSVIFPGLSGERTRAALALPAAASPAESILGHMNTPARKLIEQLIEFVPAFKFSVDLVLDRKLQILACVAGNPLGAYHVSADVAKRMYGVELKEKADIIIVDSHPFDQNLFQAMRAAYSALPMLKDRSSELIMVSPLLEALPQPIAALSSHMSETRRHLIDEAQKNAFEHHPIWAAHLIAMAEVLERTSLTTFITHGAGKSDAAKFGFGIRTSIQEALTESINRIGNSARVALLSHGGLTFLRD